MTKWRGEGENGVGITGVYFCVFDDGIWYGYEPPRCTPWTVYLGVMKRLIREGRNDVVQAWANRTAQR